MTHKLSRVSTTGLYYVLFLAFSILFFCQQVKAATVRVDFSNVIQNDFLGVNAIYHGFAFMPEQINKGMNDVDRAREFDRVQRMGLNIARTWYHPNYACGSSLWSTCDWNSPRMKALYNWLQAMKDRNVDVALNLGWRFTADTYYGHSLPNPAIDKTQYSAWVSESLHQIIEVRGFTNVKYGVLFTEPTSYESGTVPDGYTQWSYFVEMIKALHNKLVADGRRNLVKLVGPNGTYGASQLTDTVRELNNEIDIYSGHDYNHSDYNGWYNLCFSMRNTVTSTGKPYWLDEWGKQDESCRKSSNYGNYVAQGVAACINAGAQTMMSWILFDQQYIATDGSVGCDGGGDGGDSFFNCVHRWGFVKWPHDNVASPTYPYPAWYAFSLLSKYLPGRNGTKTYQTTSNESVYLSALRTSDEDYSFLVVNGNSSQQNITVNLSQPINKSLHRYLYDPANIQLSEDALIIGSDKTFSAVGSTFSDTIPSQAVVIYSSISDQSRSNRETRSTCPGDFECQSDPDPTEN